MSDPNFPPQQYPNPSQSQRAQYDQPRQQVYQQPQYTQPQANPYATGQQYAQTPQYGQPQYQQPQYAQYQYGQRPYVNPQPADTGSFGWAVLGFESLIAHFPESLRFQRFKHFEHVRHPPVPTFCPHPAKRPARRRRWYEPRHPGRNQRGRRTHPKSWPRSYGQACAAAP